MRTVTTYDKETEEVYLRARYYQPAVGRFLTRDSYTGESDDPESLHLYTYCENDGLNCVDPSGHFVDTVIDIASIVYSGYELVTAPSLANLGYLGWDVGAAIVPFIPGSYTAKAVKGGVKIATKIRKVDKVVNSGKVIVKLQKNAKAKKIKNFSKLIKNGKLTIKVASKSSDFRKENV